MGMRIGVRATTAAAVRFDVTTHRKIRIIGSPHSAVSTRVEMGEVTFRRPPLIEVSFGIRFDRPPELHTGHFGLYWAQLKSEFPETSDQAPILDPKTFGHIGGYDRFLPRVWFVHRDKSLLIQLQSDRFYLNWRRLQPTAEYPRFATLAPLFARYTTMWSNFLDQSGLGTLEISACELSYINHVLPPGGWGDLWDAGKIIKPLVGTTPLNGGFPLRAVNWGGTFDNGTSQMSLILQTAENANDRTEKLLQYEIKAESSIPIGSIDAMTDWLNQANLDVVGAFTSTTTDFAQQEIWGRVSS